ncbi:unnamed protein product [Clonostachys rosea f. rosea IK726]|uniref:Uncharacterized protein n=1 Tax=Clonostachys rosea f. rosea IK726 TaxID=1349383 RepID=A0ACA9UTS8_BIOOC|nr:unnamed protein product [Clonostachys rosea f. rosea IK726]
MSRSAGLQREREVQSFVQSWQSAQGSSLNVALNVDSLEQQSLHGKGYTPRASRDKTLTAFAQLAVLRLGVKRAMVSLIDDQHQTILAEATRNLKLGDLEAQAPHESNNPAAAGNNGTSVSSQNGINGPVTENDLWLRHPAFGLLLLNETWWIRLPISLHWQEPLTKLVGASVITRADAVCEHCLTDTCTARDESGQSYTAPGLIVPDLRLDPRFQNRPYVASEQGIRFYAGVPIISRHGHKIGAYAVSDESTRHGLTVDELQFMQGVSQAIMEHLEWARDRVDRFKGERIVRGLAAFIEGCSGMDDEPNPSKRRSSRSPSTVRPPNISVTTKRPPLTRISSRFSDQLEPPDQHLSSSPKQASGSVTPVGSRSSSPRQKKTKQPGPDRLSRMYHRAAELMRQSTLADGVILFGATATTSRQMVRALKSGGLQSADDNEHYLQSTSGSEASVGIDSSDSDTSPTTRPCKIFAYSLADERARADIEQGTALSLGTLEKYFALFPKGKTFSFTEEGAGISSEDDSASDVGASDHAEGGHRRRKVEMDHRELLKKIPGAKVVVFVPLFDYAEDTLAGGCFLWASVPGRLMTLTSDLSYLRAFGNSIMNQVGRITIQKNEAAKTTFIASMSHELRSPLHGILGAAEFLRDTNADPYQAGLIASISTCGKTLLDTLNHVLDYSKINRLGRVQMRRGTRQQKMGNFAPDSMESLNMTNVVNLGVLLEEVVDVIAAGHTFKLPGTGISQNSVMPSDGPDADGGRLVTVNRGPVSVLLDICPKTCGRVRTQPGALRRIIMNLFGNALKYTSSGFILVSLRGQRSEDGSKIETLIRVVDTGKGMSEDFLRNRLFVPFSQEDSFQPGTGLGLSIVKQIVDNLRGRIEVRSEEGKGTEVDVRLRLAPATEDGVPRPEETLDSVLEQTKSLQVRLLEGGAGLHTAADTQQQHHKVNEVLTDTCTAWLGMTVTKKNDPGTQQPDIYLYKSPPSQPLLTTRLETISKNFPRGHRPPILIVCPNIEESVQVAHQTQALTKLLPSQVIEVIPQPCGPRKLGRVISHCLTTAKQTADKERETNGIIPLPPSPPLEEGLVTEVGPIKADVNGQQPKPVPQVIPNGPISPVSPPPLDLETPSLRGAIAPVSESPVPGAQRSAPHVLVVDDNAINLQLLVMFMKKCGFTYEAAENGQEAVDKYKEAYRKTSSATGGSMTIPAFDFILMDISMPVMNGIEATWKIREFEQDLELPRSYVIALTGLASADARRNADSVGVDFFMPKPVRFAELKKLLVNK